MPLRTPRPSQALSLRASTQASQFSVALLSCSLWPCGVAPLLFPYSHSSGDSGDEVAAKLNDRLPSTYRLSRLGRATGDRSMNLSSVPSARLERSSRSLPKVETPQTCLPSRLQKIQTIFSVLTVAATLLPRWLSGTFLSVRPSRTVLHLQESITVEQTTVEPPR